MEIALRMPQRFHRLGKGLLRQACADLCTSAYLDRPKQCFVLPKAILISQQWQAFGVRAWRLVVLGEFAQRELLP